MFKFVERRDRRRLGNEARYGDVGHGDTCHGSRDPSNGSVGHHKLNVSTFVEAGSFRSHLSNQKVESFIYTIPTLQPHRAGPGRSGTNKRHLYNVVNEVARVTSRTSFDKTLRKTDSVR